MKTIEFLYPELCNIYAESYNIEYLERSCSELEVINTRHSETPRFVAEDVDMIYLGCLSERKQEMAIERLMPYKERLEELIDKGTVFLITGNAIEIFGNEIRDGKRVIPALGIFDFYSVRYMNHDRHNSQYVGEFTTENGEIITLLGHKSQFSFAYGDFDQDKLIDVEIGIGMNPDTVHEGLRRNNFFATYSLGPYMIMNPLFAKYLLRKLGVSDTLAFEKEAIEAYEYRRNELRRNLG